MTVMYMHTIEGEPAFFSKEAGCIYRVLGHKKHATLVHSLKEIRKEQKISAKNNQTIFRKGYVRVEVPSVEATVKDAPEGKIPPDDGWIEWTGGKRTVLGDTIVEVKLRNGATNGTS